MSSPLPPEKLIHDRFLGFLIWQSIPSTFFFLLFKLFFTSSSSFLHSLLCFLAFHLSQLLLSAAIAAVSSPLPRPAVSPLRLLPYLLRFLLVSSDPPPPDLRRRAAVYLDILLFTVAAAVSGVLSAVSLLGCAGKREAVKGLVLGLVYAFFYFYKKRCILEFPIIQRPPFFCFKMGLPSAAKRAAKLSNIAFVILLNLVARREGFGQLIIQLIIAYLGTLAVILCWELSHHLHRVLHTKRFVFAPPKGSAAAETNPSEPLLAALEESIPGSLPQYLAYLDLCMVCESNVHTWRRAAFFEETGETYKRVMTVCLKPLEQLACKLGEGLGSGSVDETLQLSNQLQPPTDSQLNSKSFEPLNNFQQCAWCARAVASLTACSHKEDRFGVAQLTGSNATVISTLLSCLLAVEALVGKKTSLQPPHQLMGPASIKWATPNSVRRDAVMIKKKGGQVHSKAYAMADVLRTSIYLIVSTFHDEILASAKSGLLEKDWLVAGKPLFGTQELLQQKLRLFLDFRAS